MKPPGARWSVARHRVHRRASTAMLAGLALIAYTGAAALAGYGLLPRRSATTAIPSLRKSSAGPMPERNNTAGE